MQRRFPFAALLLAVCVSTARADDEFDRHSPYWLRQGAKNSAAVDTLDQSSAAKLKPLSARLGSPLVVVATEQGNLAKALIQWGFRRGDDGAIVPVLMVERFVTYNGAREGLALVSGKDVMLFPGYQFNFDIGQVVPEGHGGDVQFTAEKQLKPLGTAKLHPVSGSLLPPPDESQSEDPTDHEGVLPRDFNGDWQLNADGRIIGRLSLNVDEDQNISGQFFSEETKSVYPVKGAIPGGTHRVQFSIEFIAAPQTFDGYLWTKDKSAMAGTTEQAQRKTGFYATRIAPKKAAEAGEPKSP